MFNRLISSLFLLIIFVLYLCNLSWAQNTSNTTNINLITILNPIYRNILNTNNNFTTNTTTYSSTTTLTTTTISTTTKPIPVFGLTKFTLSNIKFDKFRNEFKINFTIQSNLTNKNNELYALNYRISFNCTTKDDNLWFGEVAGQFLDKNSFVSSINLVSNNKINLPKPGSFIRCNSIAHSSTNNLTENINYLLGKLFII